MTPHSSGRDGAPGRGNPGASMAEHARQISPSHNTSTRHWQGLGSYSYLGSQAELASLPHGLPGSQQGK